jgi:hypothetical protein
MTSKSPDDLGFKPNRRIVQVPREFLGSTADSYALQVDGGCLAPIFNDGDMVVAAPDAPWIPGLPIVIYREGQQPWVNILEMAPPPSMMQVAEGSEAIPVVLVRILNPPRLIGLRVTGIEALHGVIGVVRPDGAFEPLSDIAAPPGPTIIDEARAFGPWHSIA